MLRSHLFQAGLGVLCAAALAALPARLHAQVAVSQLVPVAPNITAAPDALTAGFVTANPAAMQWGAPSRFGLGYGDGEINPQADGSEKTAFTTSMGGGRLVGQRFSAAGEGISVRDGSGPLDFATDVVAAALGVRVFAPLSMGALYRTVGSRDGLTDSDTTSWSVGGSYRFGEWLYLGGSYGLDKLTYKDTSDPLETVKLDDDRSVFMYGAGVRFGGNLRVHLEGYIVDRNAYNFEGSRFGQSDTSAGVFEVGWGPIVLGGQLIEVNEDVGGADFKTRTQIYDVAWAPLLGLAIGLHFERGEEKLEGSDLKTDIRLSALTLAYQF